MRTFNTLATGLAALTALTALAGAPAIAAGHCDFTLECYMSEPCAGSGWELRFDPAAGVLETVFGDLEIVHHNATGTQFAAAGPGALYLLSLGGEISTFTAQTAGDATSVTYLGECLPE